MLRMNKKVVFLFLVLAVVGGLVYGVLGPYARMGGAYGAKVIASGLFIAGRDVEGLIQEETAFLPPLFSFEVDQEAKTVTATMFGFFPQVAVYREGLGCTIVNSPIDKLRAQAVTELFKPLEGLKEKPWPQGDAPSGNPRPGGFDEVKLTEAMDFAFKQSNTDGPRGTRAVMVVYKGEIVGERYAEGFTQEIPLIGWSMTKSITSALIGILVKEGKLNLKDPAPVPEWHGEGDPRNAITLDMLLRMSSGLKWNENYYHPYADASPMLFHYVSTADYAASKSLAYEPDTHWYYSSGTSNLLQRIIRDTIGDDDKYHRFPYEALFAKIGMSSAYLEADNTGIYVGSSFFYATARDYARFGMLYEQDGVWNGERILPEGWVTYSRTATGTDPVKRYAAHWWLPYPHQYEEAKAMGVEIPEDTFYAAGHEGQFIYVIPSLDLVMVRLGLSGDEDNRFTGTLLRVLGALGV